MCNKLIGGMLMKSTNLALAYSLPLRLCLSGNLSNSAGFSSHKTENSGNSALNICASVLKVNIM